MKNILLSNKYNGEPYEIIKQVIPSNMNLLMLDELTEENFIEKVKYADYILASGRIKINNSVLDKASNLKMIQRTGVGLDSIDLDALKSRNIPLYVNKGVNSKSVAEHTILLMLAALRNLCTINNNTKNGIWNKQNQGVKTRELSEQTVGIIGMGHIGQLVAHILKSFGANVLYFDSNKLDEDTEKQLNILYADMDTIFKESDIISLHCPLTMQNKNLIYKNNIEKMKDGVIIINTARGGLILENDLIYSLKNNKVRFACLDVFEEEPIKNAELLNLENVIITPHIGGVTYDSFYRMMKEAMHNIEFFDNGCLDEIEKYKYV